RIERRAQGCHQLGQGVAEVPVLTPAETMARHPHMAAETLIVRIQRRDAPAFVRLQQPRHHRATLLVQFAVDLRPVMQSDALFDRVATPVSDLTSYQRTHSRLRPVNPTLVAIGFPLETPFLAVKSSTAGRARSAVERGRTVPLRSARGPGARSVLPCPGPCAQPASTAAVGRAD